MAIYDREWYRVERGRRPPGRTAPAVRALLIANVAVFVFEFFVAVPWFGWNPVTGGLGMRPHDVVGRFMVWEIVTSMFLHATPLHLLFNMFVLWMFGTPVERRLGSGVFLRFYFGAGIAAGLAYVAFGLLSMPFMPAVGASGAIMGILAYYTLLNPNAVVLLFFVIPMRMVWVMVLLVGFDLYGFVFSSPGSSGIAHTAHLGGALFGYLYYRYAHRIDRFFLNLELRSKRKKDRRREEDLSSLQADVDRLLQKIYDEGMTALSDRERRFLREASEKLRGRRR